MNAGRRIAPCGCIEERRDLVNTWDVTDACVEHQLAAIQAEDTHRAAVQALAAEGATMRAAGPATVATIRAAAAAWRWTADDVYHVGTDPDGSGCVTVVLRRGAHVARIPVRIVATGEQVAAQAVRQANGRR